MRRINIVILTAITLIVLLAVEIIIVRSASSYEPTIKVVFARTFIQAGTEVREDMLVLKEINIGSAHPKSLKAFREAAGKKALVSIEAGEMVLTGKLGVEDEMQPIAVKDKNNRLFTVEFKGDQANGWWLMIGQYIDIIFVPDDNAAGQAAASYGMSSAAGDNLSFEGGKRLKHIRIAALIDEKGALLNNSKRAAMPKYISFEVDKFQDEFLAYAKGHGRLEISAEPQ